MQINAFLISRVCVSHLDGRAIPTVTGKAHPFNTAAMCKQIIPRGQNWILYIPRRCGDYPFCFALLYILDAHNQGALAALFREPRTRTLGEDTGCEPCHGGVAGSPNGLLMTLVYYRAEATHRKRPWASPSFQQADAIKVRALSILTAHTAGRCMLHDDITPQSLKMQLFNQP